MRFTIPDVCTYNIIHYGHATSRVFRYIRYHIRNVFMSESWYDIVCHTYDIICWHTISSRYKHTISYIQYSMSILVKAISYIRYRIYDMVYDIQHRTYIRTYDIVGSSYLLYRMWQESRWNYALFSKTHCRNNVVLEKRFKNRQRGQNRWVLKPRTFEIAKMKFGWIPHVKSC